MLNSREAIMFRSKNTCLLTASIALVCVCVCEKQTTEYGWSSSLRWRWWV